MTQEQLAHRGGMSVSTLARLEQTSSPVMTTTIKKLARALGVRAADLMEKPAVVNA
jgi:transcriptional regulator with XRE-family HTH domain